MKNKIISCAAFIILALLWLAVGAALVFDQALLNKVWQAFLGWPVVGQLAVGLLTLPVVLGLWIWNTPWPEWLRLVLVTGLALATLYTFYPGKKNLDQTKPSLAKS